MIQHPRFERFERELRITACPLADIHHRTRLYPSITLFQTDTLIKIFSGITSVKVFAAGLCSYQPRTRRIYRYRSLDFLQHALTHHTNTVNLIAISLGCNQCIHHRRSTHQSNVLFRLDKSVQYLNKCRRQPPVLLSVPGPIFYRTAGRYAQRMFPVQLLNHIKKNTDSRSTAHISHIHIHRSTTRQHIFFQQYYFRTFTGSSNGSRNTGRTGTYDNDITLQRRQLEQPLILRIQ
ncbi:unknown [Tannerella sp. CAG:118]|nr:unknown [Tannerella sp. CAG:118]